MSDTLRALAAVGYAIACAGLVWVISDALNAPRIWPGVALSFGLSLMLGASVVFRRRGTS